MNALLLLVGGVRAAVFLGLAILAGGLLGVQTWRLDRAQDQLSALRLAAAEAALAAEAQAREIESRYAKDYAAVAGQLIKENEDARLEVDQLVAGLRDGTERLRRRFQCPPVQVPGTPAPAGGSDEGAQAGFGPADAEIAFGIARDGDDAIRQLTACQALLRVQREGHSAAR